MISFRPLEELLKAQGKPKSFLKTEKIVGGGTFTTISSAMRLPIKEGVSISAINEICRALDCQPGDVIAYIPDEGGPARNDSC